MDCKWNHLLSNPENGSTHVHGDRLLTESAPDLAEKRRIFLHLCRVHPGSLQRNGTVVQVVQDGNIRSSLGEHLFVDADPWTPGWFHSISPASNGTFDDTPSRILHLSPSYLEVRNGESLKVGYVVVWYSMKSTEFGQSLGSRRERLDNMIEECCDRLR